MALSKNETENNQVSFDDLLEGMEYEYEEEKTFKTISGKEYMDVLDWEGMKSYELDIGDEFEGIPEVTHFENKDKKYDNLRVRVADDGEYLDCYINIPKPDKLGYVTNIRKSFDFYRTAFDFIYSILKYRDERNVVDENGEEKNHFKKVNILTFAKYVDQFKRIGVRITEGNEESNYNSFIIYKME